MLSYRHAYHAGNHADVLKHVVLVHLIRYLCRKDKAFWYLDTHAGAGRYALESALATKLAEHRAGVGRLWGRHGSPAALDDYLDRVGHVNPDGRLRVYPGSPCLAAMTMRAQDRLRLFERHSRDVLHLRETMQESMREFAPRALVEHTDGFAALSALLPPPPRRALVLIDPAYEDKRDYERVWHGLKESLIRFPTGTYVVWYPQITRLEAHALPQRLQRLSGVDWLHASLRVKTPAADGFGMHGSGVFVINPAWTLRAALQEVLPYLVDALGIDEGAGFTLNVGSRTVEPPDNGPREPLRRRH